MDFTKLFDLKYLVDNNPPSDSPYTLPLVLMFLLIITAGLMMQLVVELRIVHPIWRSLLRRLPGGLYMFSIFGLLLMFARHEGSPFLSMRLLLLLLILGMIGYIIWKIIYIAKKYPQRLESYSRKN